MQRATTRLKIPREKSHVGSIPTPGTGDPSALLDSELKREFNQVSFVSFAQGNRHSVRIEGCCKQVRASNPYDRPSQEIPIIVLVDVYPCPAYVSGE